MAIVLVLTAIEWAERKRSDRRPEGPSMPDRNRVQREEHRRERPVVKTFRFKHIPAEGFIGVIEQLSRKSPLGGVLSKTPVALCERSNTVVVIAPPEMLELFGRIAEGIDQPSEFHERMAQRNRPSPPRQPRILRNSETSARGVSPQAALTSRYQNKEYLRASAVQPLEEIAKLPMALADDLDILIRRAAAAVAAAANVDTSTAGHRVKYYQGTNHGRHGLVANGVGELSAKPSPVYTAHCFRRDGKLAKTVTDRKDGTRYVSSIFLYEGDLPAARLTFGPKGHAFGDYGLYRDGRLVLVARVDSTGKVASCKCLFYAGDREDYSVRYLARKTDARFTVSDLWLNAMTLGGVRLEFNETGELNRLWYAYPRETTSRKN